MIKSYCVLTVLSFKIRNVDIYLEKIEIGRDTSRRVKGSADNDIFSRKRSVTLLRPNRDSRQKKEANGIYNGSSARGILVSAL